LNQFHPGPNYRVGIRPHRTQFSGSCSPIQTIREPWRIQVQVGGSDRIRDHPTITVVFPFLLYIYTHIYASSPRLGFRFFSRCRLQDFLSCFRRASEVSTKMVLPNDIDLLNPPAELEKRRHKLKRLVQSPNSFFMDVKCQGCFNITTVFSHSQTVVVCGNCQTVLCQPTGGRARLTEGCSFRRKGD
ncbi:hypothetical protein BHM03_00056299, partial [Ensete ventricosum]